jgi:hypothetical protein
MQRAGKGLSARGVSRAMARLLLTDATRRARPFRPALREPPTCAYAALPPLPRAGPLAADGALPGRLWGALDPQFSPGRNTRAVLPHWRPSTFRWLTCSRVSHQGSSRGVRGARGCKARDRPGAQAHLTVRRAPGPSAAQQTRADRATQQTLGEKCGLAALPSGGARFPGRGTDRWM